MIKRVVIAGSRHYSNYTEAKLYIEDCLSQVIEGNTVIIISGGAVGADMIGEQYADEHGIEIEKYPALWDKYGKKAGPIRNRQMAQVCDIAICFWDGKSKGTMSMINYAKRLGKEVFVKYI